MSALSLTLLRFAGLLALFAATAILVQYAMNVVLTRQFAQHAINRRLKLLRSGVAREEITGLIRPDAVGPTGVPRPLGDTAPLPPASAMPPSVPPSGPAPAASEPAKTN